MFVKNIVFLLFFLFVIGDMSMYAINSIICRQCNLHAWKKHMCNTLGSVQERGKT